MPQRRSSCCDLISPARVSRFIWSTHDAPDVMEWKGPGKCARIKDDVQKQNGVKNASEGDHLRSTVRMNVPSDVVALWYGVVNLVGKVFESELVCHQFS